MHVHVCVRESGGGECVCVSQDAGETGKEWGRKVSMKANRGNER